MLRGSGVTSGPFTNAVGARSANSHREIRAAPTLLNRSEFDLPMRDFHEWPPHRQAFATGEAPTAAPQGEVLSAAKGFLSKPLACVDRWAVRSISMSARSATGTCR